MEEMGFTCTHTPESHGFKGSWDQFVLQLKNADCDVIGINDYFSVAGYKKIQADIDAGALDIGDKTLLPVVEMRMTDSLANKNNSNGFIHFNFHIIFSNNLKIDDVEIFIKSLKFNGTSIASDYDDKEKLNNVKVSFKDTLDELRKDTKFKDEFLIWLPYDEYGGIDEIDPVSDGWIKNGFINESDILGSSNSKQSDFFLWKSPLGTDSLPKFSQKQFKEWFGSRKACIKGSDSHSYDDVIGCMKDKNSKPTNRHCWIKADPTFEGLKQIKYEPEHRVYIGEEPPIISKVRNNKTKYISALKINQISDNHMVDTWFKDIDIPFNKELVAIIGNKGSGKSGIADILGLVGDTHTKAEYFSFLHKSKFLKDKLAEKFKAQIVWESGGKSEEVALNQKQLDEKNNIDSGKPESVRYIPQNYFEQLTNDLETAKFQEVLEKIIFGYIPSSEQLGMPDFKSLEEYKTQAVKDEIKNKTDNIYNINQDIIKLENKKHPDYLNKINGLIENKEIEIKDQETLLSELPQMFAPNVVSGQESVVEGNTHISTWNKEVEGLNIKLLIKQNEEIELKIKIEEIEQMRTRIEQTKQDLDNFLVNNKVEALKYELDISEILLVETNYSTIDKLIKNTKNELTIIKTYLKSVEGIEADNTQQNNKSIIWELKLLTDKINAEALTMTLEQQAFQKNEQAKKNINNRINELSGSNETPANGTLNFYKHEKEFIENVLPVQLNIKREERVSLSLEIFNSKSKVLQFYNSFKKAVDDQISLNQEMLGDYDIKIDSSFNLELSFCDNFLSTINQNKKGSFYGKDDGRNRLKEIIESCDLNEEASIKNVLESIILYLEKDQRDGNETERYIKDQVNDLNMFYDFLFSLDYLKPKYELKLGNKTINKLSPGERGALLLIFYLMIDKEVIPLVIDQPEDNLDNESVYNMLSRFIKKAKENRQIIMVTHNPNLAVGADAEQIIHVNINKQMRNEFTFTSGAIEMPEINKKIVRILEGTRPAFDKRKLKYQEKS